MLTSFVLVPSSFEAAAHGVCSKTVPFFMKVASVVVGYLEDVSVAPDGLGSCFAAWFLFAYVISRKRRKLQQKNIQNIV